MKQQRIPLKDVALDERNARKHSKRNLEAIAESLRTFGQVKPIVVWNGTVIAGNGTVEAARTLEWDAIEAVVVPNDWDEERARAYAIADNRTAELAEWNGETLLEVLELVDAGGLLDAAGFTANELNDLQMVWGATPDLEKLLEEHGTPTDEDGMERVSFKVPVDVAEKWKHAVKQAQGDSDLERLCNVIEAAYEVSITDAE